MRLPLCRSAANSLAMQRAMTLLVFLALLAAAPFLQGALPTSPAPASCCAAMLKNDAQDDCGRQAPKSKPDRQCCAMCAIGMEFVVPGEVVLPEPLVADEIFAAYSSSACSRLERRFACGISRVKNTVSIQEEDFNEIPIDDDRCFRAGRHGDCHFAVGLLHWWRLLRGPFGLLRQVSG